MSLLGFYQNDDWVYYRMVENFLKGNFKLDPISAPTFYTQGIMGIIFSKIFGFGNLYFLTILISLASIFILWWILFRYLKLSKFVSFFISTLLLFNPIFVYSIWGFMTENYFIFWLLINFLFFYRFEESQKFKDFVLLLISIIFSFMLRQVAFVFPLALSFYYLIKKKYKLSILSGGAFVLYYAFYLFVFPKTPEMYEKPLQFHHLLNFNYSYALIYGSLLYISALFLPLLFGIINSSYFKNYRKLFIFIGIFIILFIKLNSTFKPQTISFGEFPYFENTWERMGFYPRGIVGTKYQFKGNFDLYKYWDLSAKLAISFIISYLIVYFDKKKLSDFNVIFSTLYIGILLLTETFYDRYLLVLFIPALFFFAKNINFNSFTVVSGIIFVTFLAFYSYQFSMDFILTNKYIWDKSQELVSNQNIKPKTIHGTNAWKLLNQNYPRLYDYFFSYDSPNINDFLSENYKLLEVKEIKFPLNLFINSKIYMYKKL